MAPRDRREKRQAGYVAGVTPSAASTVVAVVAALTAVAAADPGARAKVGAAPVASGHAWVSATAELSLSTRAVGAPWSLALDGAVGLGPRLTIGLSQSAAALGTVDRSGGLCLDSAAHTCPQRWRGALVDVRWRLRDGAWTAAALARLGVAGVTPVLPLVRLGARVGGGRGRWWTVAQPEVAVSLGHRELGNRSTLEVPVWLGVDLGPAGLWLRTGARGELAGLGDKLEIPIGLGVAVARGRWRAGVDAGWPQLLGPQNSFKQRLAGVWLAWGR